MGAVRVVRSAEERDGLENNDGFASGLAVLGAEIVDERDGVEFEEESVCFAGDEGSRLCDGSRGRAEAEAFPGWFFGETQLRYSVEG